MDIECFGVAELNPFYQQFTKTKCSHGQSNLLSIHEYTYNVHDLDTNIHSLDLNFEVECGNPLPIISSTIYQYSSVRF